MTRLRFTHRFERNLNGILDYISRDDAATAKHGIGDIRHGSGDEGQVD